MDTVNYYTDSNGVMTRYAYDYHPIKDNWLSDCHKQPVLEWGELIFLDVLKAKAYARCRRCGYHTNFSNENFRW